MLLNPGGPGGSGLTLSELGPIISQDFRRRDVGGAYDWIGFDPRGVGSSKPSLSCDPNYFHGDRPEYVPTTQALYDTWQARSRAYAKACGRAGGRLLAHMRTTDSARDMDRIRAALGASRINYYGFSYGTYLGQVYETLFPTRVRRMVLDSNVDPRKVWYQANLNQDIAFERNLGLFFDWLAAARRGLPPRHDQSRRDAALRRGAVAGGSVADPGGRRARRVGRHLPLRRLRAVPVAGARGSRSPTGSRPAAGDAVVAEYRSFDTPGDDNSYAVYNAVSCVDDTWKDESFLADQNATYAKAPFLTWGNAWFNGPCYHWPAKGHRHTKVTGRGVGRVLLVDETNDAATPYSGSRYLRSLYKKSRLIAVVGGTNHAVTPSGNPCTDRRIFDYLATGKLPHRKAGAGADVSCPDPAVADARPALELLGRWGEPADLRDDRHGRGP